MITNPAMIVAAAKAAATIPYDMLRNVHVAITKLSIVAVAMVVVMWLFNTWDLKGVNWVFFFVGALLILHIMIGPGKVLVSMGIGAAYASNLSIKKLMDGSLGGLSVLFKIILGIVVYWWMISGFLATWSFVESPRSFFPFAGMILLLMGLYAFYGKTSEKVTIFIVTAYALAIIGLALWPTTETTRTTIQSQVTNWVGGATTRQAELPAMNRSTPVAWTARSTTSFPAIRCDEGRWVPGFDTASNAALRQLLGQNTDPDSLLK
jgi:hypothetical protein